jgi:phage/plasmid-like protein (TIGR03299 family)
MSPSPKIDLAERIKIIGQRINEGRDSYAGRLDAWHSLGNVSGTFRTWKEMLDVAKAAYPVVKLQLEFQGQPINSWGTFRIDTEVPKGLEKEGRWLEVGGAQYFVTFLGNIGKDYKVIQHTEGFELLDHLVGQIDGAHYETMGTLDFGRIVWGQVDPNVSIRVGDDVSDIFLSFLTSHDGSRAFDIYETATRQVCRNTVRVGSLNRLAASMRIRHTRNADKRIADLKAEVDDIKSVALSMQDRLTYLSRKKVTKESLTTIFNRLFPPTTNDDGVEESSSRRDNKLATILSLYESNDNNAFPEFRGTAYNLLNAIVEETDHYRSSKGDGRAESAVFGSGDKLKTRALELVLQESEKMPNMPQRGDYIEVDNETLELLKVPAKVN